MSNIITATSIHSNAVSVFYSKELILLARPQVAGLFPANTLNQGVQSFSVLSSETHLRPKFDNMPTTF